MKNLRASCGFTLIEIMVVVLIVGILAAIAVPTYSQYVARGKRADMKTVVVQAEAWLERFFTENNRFTDEVGGTTNAEFARRFTQVPQAGAAYYTLTGTFTTNTFTLTASPTGSMAGDACGTYTKTNVLPLKSSTGTAADCVLR